MHDSMITRASPSTPPVRTDAARRHVLTVSLEEWFHGKEGNENAGDERFRAVMRSEKCPDCHGERLQPGPRNVRLDQRGRIGGIAAGQVNARPTQAPGRPRGPVRCLTAAKGSTPPESDL